MGVVTASHTARQRRARAQAGDLAIVVRWEHRPAPGRPVRRLLICCRACGAPYVGTRDVAVLRAWTDHVRQVHPEDLHLVPFAATEPAKNVERRPPPPPWDCTSAVDGPREPSR